MRLKACLLGFGMGLAATAAVFSVMAVMIGDVAMLLSTASFTVLGLASCWLSVDGVEEV